MGERFYFFKFYNIYSVVHIFFLCPTIFLFVYLAALIPITTHYNYHSDSDGRSSSSSRGSQKGWIVQIFYQPKNKMSVEGTLYPGIQRLVRRGKVILTPIPEEYKKLKKKVEDRIRNTFLCTCIEKQRSEISSCVDSLFIPVFVGVVIVVFIVAVCLFFVVLSTQ